MLLAALIALAGLAAILHAILVRIEAREQFCWPTATGTVVVSGVALSRGYFPNVEYRYVHEGQSYYGIEVNSGAVGRAWKSMAQRISLRYPVGASVTVYVNPRDPKDSVLEPGGDWLHMPLVMTIGGVFLVVGVTELFSHM